MSVRLRELSPICMPAVVVFAVLQQGLVLIYFPFFFGHACVCVCVRPSVHQSVCLSVYLSVGLSAFLSFDPNNLKDVRGFSIDE